MPATELTWRDMHKMHGVFMASSVALLLSTVWMYYADHNREWKKHHDTARNLDLTTNEWAQIQYKTDIRVQEDKKLSANLTEARLAPLNEKLLQEFIRTVDNDVLEARLLKKNDELKSLLEASKGTSLNSDSVLSKREALLEEFRTLTAKARFREDSVLTNRKNTSARLDAAKARVDIGVRDSLSEDSQAKLQAEAEDIKKRLDQLNLDYQTAADHRKRLDRILKQITGIEDEAKRIVDANRLELENLKTAYHDRQMTYFTSSFPFLGKKWLTWPVLDAFNSPRKIDNMWSDGLTIDYNFQRVRRFDRCTTCHQSMEKSLPGQADKPLFVKEQFINFVLTPPKDKPADETLKSISALETVYGFRIADAGALNREDVSVSFVLPQSIAARAQVIPERSATGSQVSGSELRDAALQTNTAIDSKIESYPLRPGIMFGDVILRINDDLVGSQAEVKRFLLNSVQWGKPVTIQVRRGMQSPYVSHPRLDLFVGSLSPHKMSTFACSSCHEGQGSATDFKWASHMPSSPEQQNEWTKKYKWFDNHHWIFPMYPKRFAEAACLKCHHDVVELEPSERFPEAPAPKVTHGYHLIRKYGCYGCHEITGFDGPTRRVGPDMRIEPNFFAAALEVKAHLQRGQTPGTAGASYSKLTKEEKSWLDQLTDHPELDQVRRRVYEMLVMDEKLNKSDRRFSPDVHKLASSFKDIDTPGDLRKPGPSLRYVASKLDDKFLYDWIREPKHFRTDSRMPQFFGLHKHLEQEPESKQIAEEYEPIEILGIAAYLKQRSQSFSYLTATEPLTKTTSEEMIVRGKIAFEERGCLACHNHKEFEGTKKFRQAGEIVQGPDLSGIGTKFDPNRNPKGRDWLYSWIKQPSKYHARTVMPDLFLDPIVKKDGEGKVISITDPAADIVAYLLTSQNDWKTQDSDTEIDNETLLDKFVFENLKESFYEAAAKKFSKSGIPAEMDKELKGAEKELLTRGSNPLTKDQKLQYVGRKTISKYGCYGCHDIPGFEDAKPIGTALADWGRKDTSKLAFEHITHYLHDQDGHGHDSASHGTAHLNDSSPEFFKEQIESGNRTGFLYQKLAEPRSYDFLKTKNKKYNERLRMPQFPFNDDEREDLITFVLGLIADPPANKFVYHPDDRAAAMIAGRQAIDKYNCAGCHLFEAEKWKVSFAPGGTLGEQSPSETFPFLNPHYSSEQIEASKRTDHRGLLQTTFTGMPSLSDKDAKADMYDVEGELVENDSSYNPLSLNYRMDIWSPTVVEGKTLRVGVIPLSIRAKQLDFKRSSKGGMLTKYLLPHVVKRERQVNTGAKGSEAWGWLPPSLHGEGKKVQSAWLHDFLLNPYPIRPAVVLRMPKFNMSSAEATNLVKYFSFLDNAEYPYEFGARRQPAQLEEKEAAYIRSGDSKDSRMDGAMKIVTNVCVKCHIISDFEPKGSDRAKAPNLARVYERFRPGYLRDWIANPKQILPYTSMPVNISYASDKPFLGGEEQKQLQQLYHGTSLEQVDALVDMLMNFDAYTKQKTPVSPLVPIVVTTAPEQPQNKPPEAEKKDGGGGG